MDEEDWFGLKEFRGRHSLRSRDYLVYDQQDGGDAYAVAKDAFERMYERS